MDREANYVAVGAFVLLVLAMVVSFVFWYTDQQDKRTYQRYEIYFQGSVSGLTAGSPVRYLGVDVGKVVRIMLDPEQRKRVLVIADIDSSAPIDVRTEASLSLQGVTGLLYIDLKQDKLAVAAGALPTGQRYPVIRSAPSDFAVLLSSLPAFTTHAIELLDRVNQLFSEDNVRAVHATLENVRQASERLPATLRGIEELSADLRRTAQRIDGTVAGLHDTAVHAAPDVEAALVNVRRLTDNLASASRHLDQLIADNQPGLTRFSTESLPEFERLLRDSREAAREFRDLSRSLKQDPSQLLYQPRQRGVEVAK